VPGWAYLAAVLAERHRRAAHRLARVRAVTATLWPGLVAPVPPLAEAGRPGHGPESWESPQSTGTLEEGPDWPREPWPTPPWLGQGVGRSDWTGMRPPPVASALRRPTPEQGTDQ
jgi:hypothetical protein